MRHSATAQVVVQAMNSGLVHVPDHHHDGLLLLSVVPVVEIHELPFHRLELGVALGVDRLLLSCLKLDRIDAVLSFSGDRA